MKRSIFVLFFLFVIENFIPIKAQQSIPKYFYKHYEGHIDNTQITVDLTFIKKDITGYYYYFSHYKNCNNNIYYGKSIPLNGILNSNDEIKLREFSNKGALFKAKFTDEHKISGTWESYSRDKFFNFSIKENYPQGSIPLNVYYLYLKYPLIERQKYPYAAIELTLLLPDNYDVPNILESVREIIINKFFDTEIPVNLPDKMLKQKAVEYLSFYKKINKGVYDKTRINSFNWSKDQTVRVHYNQNYILSLEFYNYAYTGGEHGISISKFIAINLKNGQILKLDDIFKQGYKKPLKEIINKILREKYLIKPDEELRKSGFLIDQVKLIDNFYINNSGIGFYYNSYEIASYLNGPTDIFIPFEKINDLLKADSPINWIIKQ